MEWWSTTIPYPKERRDYEWSLGRGPTAPRVSVHFSSLDYCYVYIWPWRILPVGLKYEVVDRFGFCLVGGDDPPSEHESFLLGVLQRMLEEKRRSLMDFISLVKSRNPALLFSLLGNINKKPPILPTGKIGPVDAIALLTWASPSLDTYWVDWPLELTPPDDTAGTVEWKLKKPVILPRGERIKAKRAILAWAVVDRKISCAVGVTSGLTGPETVVKVLWEADRLKSSLASLYVLLANPHLSKAFIERMAALGGAFERFAAELESIAFPEG